MRAMRAAASAQSARISRCASGGAILCAASAPWAGQWVGVASRLVPTASPFLKAGDGLQNRAWPVAAVELQADQFVPPVPAGAIGAGQNVDDRVAREAGAGARLHGGHTHRLIGNEVPQHGEALEFPVEEFTQRFRRYLTRGEAGAAAGN